MMREAADIVREVGEAIRSELEPDLAQEDPWYAGPPVGAGPTTRSLTEEELLTLSEEVGLRRRRKAVRELACRSVRLTPAERGSSTSSRCRLGGAPDLPGGFEWPTWNGRELAFLGQIDLAEVAAVAPEAPLSRRGLLLFFYEATGQPSGLHPSHRGSCRVVHVDASADLRRAGDRASFPEYPLHLSSEIMLPRSWSSPVEALELDADEITAWEELREKLALAQGVELEELAPQWQSLHRLLGYPEELGSGLELDCQFAWAGIDVEAGDSYLDPRREALEAAATDWRLLLQVSDDERLGTSWGEGFGRLWLLIRRRDLEAFSFDQVWAIRR